MEVSESVKVTSAKMGVKESWKEFESAWINSELSLLARFLYTIMANESAKIEPPKKIFKSSSSNEQV